MSVSVRVHEGSRKLFFKQTCRLWASAIGRVMELLKGLLPPQLMWNFQGHRAGVGKSRCVESERQTAQVSRVPHIN